MQRNSKKFQEIRRGRQASGRVDPTTSPWIILDYNKLRIAVLVAPAQPADGGLDSAICNPKAISGTDCPIQGPLPNPDCSSVFV